MSSDRGLEPGDSVPDFELPDANVSVNQEAFFKSTTFDESGGVIMFTCNHCPYVIANEERIESIASKCREKGLGFVGINSNDPIVYPSDDWEHMVNRAKSMSYPYLHDADQSVAHAFGAERTPEFYLVNSKKTIVYRGRLDDSPRDPSKATTSELADAIELMLSGEKVSVTRTDSIGCSVKWKI
tara:strand:- start:131 stop:682 length:552 start_codon:yes stop_codon:yes gene_type:complete